MDCLCIVVLRPVFWTFGLWGKCLVYTVKYKSTGYIYCMLDPYKNILYSSISQRDKKNVFMVLSCTYFYLNMKKKIGLKQGKAL